MEDAAAWLRRKLLEHRVSQAELAKSLALDVTVMSRMVNGKRRITADERGQMEEFFERTAPSGFEEQAANFEAPVASDAPIYRSTADAAGDWLVERGAPPVDFRRRPRSAAAAAQVYGFYAPNARCWPRFKTGEIVWVDPSRPVREGDDILLLMKIPRRTALKAVLGEFAASSSKVAIVDYQTRERREYPAFGSIRHHVLPRES